MTTATARRSLPTRLFLLGIKATVYFLLISLAWVGLYALVPPPVTATMVMDSNGATRDWTPLRDISPHLVRAAIAGEDGKFCTHDGFDREAIEQAIQENISGKRQRGGSTISQQVAKNAFLWQGGGFFRKGLEAWFTFLIEIIWGKVRIMEVYLNIAETGIGTYGVQAGAQRYFGKDATDLTRIEAARMIAALPSPKTRAVQSPRGFVRRYGNSIAARINVVRRDGLDACVYS